MSGLPEFIHDLPDEQVQPIAVRAQHDYIAVIQWDGTGEFQHWVLIPKDELTDFVNKLHEVAA